MKKLISILLLGISILSLSGCGSDKPKERTNSKPDTASVSNTKTTEKTKDEENGKVIFEDEYAKIIYAGIDLNYDLGPKINVVVENKCNQDLLIQCKDVLVDDYSADPIFSCEVLVGKKVKDDITLYKVDKNFESIQGKFIIMQKDKLGTNLKEEQFSMTFNSSAKQKIKEENKVVFENEYAKISYVGVDRDNGPKITLKIENKSNQSLTIKATDVVVDGYMVDPRFSSDISPNRKMKSEISFTGTGVRKNFKSIEGNFRIEPKDKPSELLKEEPFTINY